MKKILFLLISIIGSLVSAKKIYSYDLDYYVKVNSKVYQVKKIYDSDDNILFNVNITNYGISNEFEVSNKLDIDVDLFNSLSYFSYYGKEEKDDFTYYLAQVFIWRNLYNYKLNMCNKNGTIINTYDDIMLENDIAVNNYYKIPDIFNVNYYEVYAGDTLTINGRYDDTIFDTDNSYGMNIYYHDKDLIIDNINNIGSYRINLNKNYSHEDYMYSDGTNKYYLNKGGPVNLNYYFDLVVKGIKLTINENIIGDKQGDIFNSSSYVLDDNINRYEILNNDYIKTNTIYKISNPNDFGLEIINNEVLVESYDDIVINIDKKIITKDIVFNISDNNNYYIYLKSNNELYNTINKENNIVTLPYGNYYIKDDNSYYEEISLGDVSPGLLEFNIENVEEIVEEISDITEDIVEEDEDIQEKVYDIIKEIDDKEIIDEEIIDEENNDMKEEGDLEIINLEEKIEDINNEDVVIINEIINDLIKDETNNEVDIKEDTSEYYNDSIIEDLISINNNIDEDIEKKVNDSRKIDNKKINLIDVIEINDKNEKNKSSKKISNNEFMDETVIKNELLDKDNVVEDINQKVISNDIEESNNKSKYTLIVLIIIIICLICIAVLVTI